MVGENPYDLYDEMLPPKISKRLKVVAPELEEGNLRYTHPRKFASVENLFTYVGLSTRDLESKVEDVIKSGTFCQKLDAYDKQLVRMEQKGDALDTIDLVLLSKLKQSLEQEKATLAEKGVIKSVSAKLPLFVDSSEVKDSIRYANNGETYEIEFVGGHNKPDLLSEKHKAPIERLFEAVAKTNSANSLDLGELMLRFRNELKVGEDYKVGPQELYVIVREPKEGSDLICRNHVVGVANFQITPLSNSRVRSKKGLDQNIYHIYANYASVDKPHQSHGIGRTMLSKGYEYLKRAIVENEKANFEASGFGKNYDLKEPILVTSSENTSEGSFEFVSAAGFMRYSEITPDFYNTQGVLSKFAQYHKFAFTFEPENE